MRKRWRIGGSGYVWRRRRQGGSGGRQRVRRELGQVGTTRGSGAGCLIHWLVVERGLSTTWFWFSNQIKYGSDPRILGLGSEIQNFKEINEGSV